MASEQQTQPRTWSMSTATTTAPTLADDANLGDQSATWPLPSVPVPPPVPVSDADMASWRRRSLKRDSYILQTQQVPSTFAHSIRENHRASIRASRLDLSQRPQSTYRPLAGRARDIQDRAVLSHGTLWTNDRQNPQNWSSSRKALQAAAPLVAVLSLGLSSSVLTPITDLIHSHDQSMTVSVLPHAIFALGLACVPLTASFRELSGRRILLAATLGLYGAFSLIAALLRDTLVVVIIMRFLAGVAASPLLALSPTIFMDIFVAGQRTVPTILFAATIAAGTSIGPLLGGVAIETRSPAWAQYIILFTIGACLALVACMRESSKEAILRKTSTARSNSTALSRLSNSLQQPFRILTAESAVWYSVICIAINSATGLGLVQAVPITFQSTYEFGLTAEGAVLISLICGFFVSMLSFAIFHNAIYKPKRAAWEDGMATEIEKAMAPRGRPKSRHRSASAKKLKRNSVYRQSAQVRSTSAVSLRRVSTAQAAQSHDHLPTSNAFMSAGLAVAIAQELSSVRSYDGGQITPESVWTISGTVSGFEQLMNELAAQYGVSFDRQKLLELYETWSSPRASVAGLDNALISTENLKTYRTPDQNADSHRAAALAALEKDPSAAHVEATSTDHRRRHARLMPTASFSQQRPPAHWRLPLALPGAVLSTVGVFILAWTTSPSVSWIAPVVGLGVFGCGAFLNAICICLFLTDRFGADDTVSAVISISTISYTLAFAFSMFTVPLYQGLSVAWATSIFGFITIIPWFGSFALLRSKS